MTIFYFTSTGNSLSVAKKIGGKLVSIPQVVDLENQHYKDDVIGIVFPTYGSAPPQMVKKFLEKATFDAKYIFAIGTYGNMAGSCMYDLKKYSDKNGYKFDYVNNVKMVDNYLYMFDINKQIQTLPAKKVQEQIANIVNDINSHKLLEGKASVIIRLLSRLINSMAKPSEKALSYIVNDSCTKCGLCSKVCPAKNITVDTKVNFGTHCENCLACVHLCPENAIHLKQEKSSKRWLNPEVTVKEIIEANNRN